jgi:integrase
LLAPELANGITRVKGVASKGVRLGNWLTARQAQALLNAPDTTTNKGLRDRAILAVLLGCGLRRSEVAALTFKHIQQWDGRWCIVDLVGKRGLGDASVQTTAALGNQAGSGTLAEQRDQPKSGGLRGL